MSIFRRVDIALGVGLAGKCWKYESGYSGARGVTTQGHSSNFVITTNVFAKALQHKLQEATRASPPSWSRKNPEVIARSGRSLLYEDSDTYVLMEPGEEEVFVNESELRQRLKSWLVNWPGNELPDDLAKLGRLDDVIDYLVASACELDLGGGMGSIQWYQVRLE
ncbi:hypothetical protein MPTK1_1g17020 [Marchantia polymorpha subsp. ruderalis]|uniref:Uncharacterized protein n=2 Tax=Marchantia polymorpha TaxID=3197 RepID=A0A176W939_MARPO|nr:hypothetical protein AXG93_401s1010 [Marchantia polymorpha subsp. ruderalis]PTQ49974.1 hypothetical protein MARPO_0001s0042 [Marchantia polymorpha]BBM98898.1 hypothetical protein Mp_1g17020 [Marchantia polymorpha subsp. ruderalis]|eukprot:PTQ49974.1 hypothetical protein MARPO_0001s0042 [Marchantia polymorpha]